MVVCLKGDVNLANLVNWLYTFTDVSMVGNCVLGYVSKFRTAKMNRRKTGSGLLKSMGIWWFSSPLRQDLNDLLYSQSLEILSKPPTETERKVIIKVSLQVVLLIN